MEQLSIFNKVDDFQEQQTDDRELSIEEINKFINEHKLTERIDIINTENASKRRFTILSLFSGCGGLDLGFKGGFTYLHGNYERNNFDSYLG
ncbi:hypothetical protein AC231_14700 [Clostridium pasteurianum]|uniref:hypothetical protein n=1 Tax=Clostridium pasteurianum TaxID=1501 RepID=UPI00097A6895|nr:hypothetical protein [Clostridium pasteurianum]OMH21674.1 hypothetical protein AC231_14700 [Clostridium pasteurianum]